MVKNDLYKQLIDSEPMGFIDPLTDLGEFDLVQMKFKEPVRQLVNKYSGKPYNLSWQQKIENMRGLYIQYQKSLKLEDESQSVKNRIKNKQSQKHIHEIITTYLKLGFRFKEIEPRISFNTRLRRKWKRSDYIEATSPQYYLKRDLQDGYSVPIMFLPGTMKIH